MSQLSEGSPSSLAAKSEAVERRYEDQHVHQVYEQIASHFSETRFKPWPVVDSFLRSRQPGSIGLDVGCGNGKYLSVNRDVFIIASDRSASLIKIASEKQYEPHSTIIADSLSLPHPHDYFDFVISIAVVHHLSSRERRRDALRCILEVIRPISFAPVSVSAAESRNFNSGEALIFVWALEQKNSRRGWDKGDEQDILVPWVLKESGNNRSKASTVQGVDATKVEHLLDCNGNSRNQESNRNGSNSAITTTIDASVVPESKDKDSTLTNVDSTAPSQTFQRYYHLYREGELEEDIEAVGGKVVRRGYDRDNWWAIFTKQP